MSTRERLEEMTEEDRAIDKLSSTDLVDRLSGCVATNVSCHKQHLQLRSVSQRGDMN